MTTAKSNYPDLEIIVELVFKTCGIHFSNFQKEAESQEYNACTFQIDGRNVKFRTAKITPTKIGQFVTIWKRNEKRITVPFDIADDNEFYIIAARKNTAFGLFVFPKSILHENKILTDKTRDGKRGIRVYPIWDLSTNKQAEKTQSWQKKYFLEIAEGKLIDPKKAKFLLS